MFLYGYNMQKFKVSFQTTCFFYKRDVFKHLQAQVW